MAECNDCRCEWIGRGVPTVKHCPRHSPARVAELERLVEAAYREGYRLGSDGAFDWRRQWNTSNARTALAALRGEDCAHDFQAKPGMYDTTHRYCTKCGRAE